MQDQIGIRHRTRRLLPRAFEFRAQLRATIDPRIRRDPESAFEARRLPLIQRFPRGAEHCVAESDCVPHPHFTSVRPAIVEETRKRLQKTAIHRRSVPIEYADDAAQCEGVSMEVTGPSNGTK